MIMSFTKRTRFGALLSLFVASANISLAATSPADLVAALKDSPTQVSQLSLLQDSDFVFDFVANKKAAGAGGAIVLANSANFPVTTGAGISLAVGFLEACGMNTPHTHPRASEFLFSVNGTIQSGMIEENGARFVPTVAPPGSGVVFPQGSIHFQQNLGCEPVTFVSGLNFEDPGAVAIAQRYFGLPPEVVGASLGELGAEEVAGLESKIPDTFALGIQSCLDRCGIERGSQPTAQRQPRVPGNALPSGYSSPPPPSDSNSDASSRLSDNSNDSSAEKITPAIIALIVGVVLMGLGLFLIGAAWCMKRGKGNKYVKTGETFAPAGHGYGDSEAFATE